MIIANEVQIYILYPMCARGIIVKYTLYITYYTEGVLSDLSNTLYCLLKVYTGTQSSASDILNTYPFIDFVWVIHLGSQNA